MPRSEEHRAADVQADPFPAVPPGGVDPGAVPDALRCYPAGFCGGRRSGSRCRRAISSLAVFVVVIVVVVIVVVAVVRRLQHTDLR